MEQIIKNCFNALLPVFFLISPLDDKKDALVSGKNEAEYRIDIQQWLKTYVKDASKDPVGIDAMSKYLASIANNPNIFSNGKTGRIPQEFINSEFKYYNDFWAPLIYFLENNPLNEEYKKSLIIYFSDKILIKHSTHDKYSNSQNTVIWLNRVVKSCAFIRTPIIHSKNFDVGYGLVAEDNMREYIVRLYSLENSEKQNEYIKILAFLNPHSICHTIGDHFVVKDGLIIIVPSSTCMEKVLRFLYNDINK